MTTNSKKATINKYNAIVIRKKLSALYIRRLMREEVDRYVIYNLTDRKEHAIRCLIRLIKLGYK